MGKKVQTPKVQTPVRQAAATMLVVLMVLTSILVGPSVAAIPRKAVPPEHWAVSTLAGIVSKNFDLDAVLLDTFLNNVTAGKPVPRATLAVVFMDYITAGGYKTPSYVVSNMPAWVLEDIDRLVLFLEPELTSLNLDVPQVLGSIGREKKWRKMRGYVPWEPEKVDLSGVRNIPGTGPQIPVSSVKPIFKLTVSPTFLNLKTGCSFGFRAEGTMKNGSLVPVSPQWHVTGDIGEIGPDGRFAATKHGAGMVVARVHDHNDLTAYAIVRVDPLDAEGLNIEPSSAELCVGETLEVTVTGQDKDGRSVPVETELIFEGDAGTLDGSVFTATTPGNGTFIALAPEKHFSASAEVLVLAYKKTGDESGEVPAPRHVTSAGADLTDTTVPAAASGSEKAGGPAAIVPTGRIIDYPPSMAETFEKPVLLNFANVPLRDVIRHIFVKEGGLDVTIDTSVQGNVSMHIKDKPLYQVLASLASSHNLDIQVEHGIVRVRARKMDEIVEKMIVLKYAKAAEAQRMLMRVKSGLGRVEIEEQNNSLFISERRDVLEKMQAIIAKIDTLEAVKQVVTRMFRLTHADATEVTRSIGVFKSREGQVDTDRTNNAVLVTDYESNVEKMAGIIEQVDVSMVSTRIIEIRFAEVAKIKQIFESGIFAEGGGMRPRLSVDERTNALIATGTDEHLRLIETWIEKLDTQTLQVLIQAMIVEVTLTDDQNLGINWSMLTPSRGSTKSVEEENKLDINLNPDSGGGTFKFGTLSTEQFNAVLQTLKTITNVQLVSNPTITCVNGEQASIIVGTVVPIAKYSVNKTTGTWEIAGYDEKKIGIHLEVTPVINHDGFITMDVHPKVESITDYRGQFNERPVTTTREATTKVLVRDKETLVIGGMVRENATITEAKVPFIGDIPMVGSLFKRKKVSKEKTETMVFITPHIIREAPQIQNLPAVDSSFDLIGKDGKRLTRAGAEIVTGGGTGKGEAAVQ